MARKYLQACAWDIVWLFCFRYSYDTSCLVTTNFFPCTGPSKSRDASATNKSQFNVDEFISNVFDINKLKEKNPFYVDNDESDNESDTTETTEESEDVVLCSSSSGNETSRYVIALLGT